MLPLKLLTSMYNFNPHPHTEGDNNFSISWIYAEHFNPHPRVEGDFLPCWVDDV